MPCLAVLFEPGDRPDREAIQAAVEGSDRFWVTTDAPARGDKDAAPEPDRVEWLEMLVDGLTFDLVGLSPGPCLPLPSIRHRFGFVGDGSDCEAIALAPGPHLTAVGSALPVVKAMTMLGAAIANAPNLEACGLIWIPAGTAMAVDYFDRVVGDWIDGGPFPALGLTGVDQSGAGRLASDGLSFFIGRELVLHRPRESGRAGPNVGGTRLLVQLIDSFVGNPALDEPRRIRLGDDRIYELRHSEDGRRIEARPTGGGG